MDGVILWKEVCEIAEKVATHFSCKYSAILPETRKRARHFGECAPCERCADSLAISEANCSQKVIRIRVHQVNNPKRPLSSRTILRTLAHELAHCRSDGWDHGRKHRRLTSEISQYIRSLGYTV